MMEIDDLDRKLLAEIQKDATQNSDQLGDKIGLSASAVQRRLKALRRSGAIQAEVALVNPAVSDHAMTLIALMEIDRESPGERDKLRRWCRAEDQIQQANFVTGTTDLLLVVLLVGAETDILGHEDGQRPGRG